MIPLNELQVKQILGACGKEGKGGNWEEAHGFREAGSVLCFHLGGSCTGVFTYDNSLSGTHLTCVLLLAVYVTLQLKSKPEVFKRLSKIATLHIKNFKFVDFKKKNWKI